jgi:hypothetical protein
MTALDEALQKAAKRGLQALTLWKLQDGRWQANASDDRIGWRVEHDADPVQAVRKALGAKTLPNEPSVFD